MNKEIHGWLLPNGKYLSNETYGMGVHGATLEKYLQKTNKKLVDDPTFIDHATQHGYVWLNQSNSTDLGGMIIDIECLQSNFSKVKQQVLDLLPLNSPVSAFLFTFIRPTGKAQSMGRKEVRIENGAEINESKGWKSRSFNKPDYTVAPKSQSLPKGNYFTPFSKKEPDEQDKLIMKLKNMKPGSTMKFKEDPDWIQSYCYKFFGSGNYSVLKQGDFWILTRYSPGEKREKKSFFDKVVEKLKTQGLDFQRANSGSCYRLLRDSSHFVQFVFGHDFGIEDLAAEKDPYRILKNLSKVEKIYVEYNSLSRDFPIPQISTKLKNRYIEKGYAPQVQENIQSTLIPISYSCNNCEHKWIKANEAIPYTQTAQYKYYQKRAANKFKKLPKRGPQECPKCGGPIRYNSDFKYWYCEDPNKCKWSGPDKKIIVDPINEHTLISIIDRIENQRLQKINRLQEMKIGSKVRHGRQIGVIIEISPKQTSIIVEFTDKSRKRFFMNKRKNHVTLESLSLHKAIKKVSK